MSQQSAKRTEVVSEVVFLGKLVERIVSGRIRVPKFQRAFVWRQGDLHSLLDSVFRGFPIGSILVWDTDDDIESRASVGPVEIADRPGGTVGYLLDGQQRVSTLVGTLRLPLDIGDVAETIVDDLDWAVYCDLDTGEFMRAPKTGLEPQHFPVRSLLNTAGFFRRVPPHHGGTEESAQCDAVAGGGGSSGERLPRLPASVDPHPGSEPRQCSRGVRPTEPHRTKDDGGRDGFRADI